MEKILLSYPEINLEWLVSGIGQMLKSYAETNKENSENVFSDNQITISKDEFIELQRKALKQEDRIRELEKQVEELGKS